MIKLGFVLRPGSRKAKELVSHLLVIARRKSCEVLFDANSAPEGEPVSTLYAIAQECDVVVTLGGDGTLLSVARHVKVASPLFIGVHFGHLGFLTEVFPDEAAEALEKALSGELRSRDRQLSTVEVVRDGAVLFSEQALNEAVVQKSSESRLVDLSINVDDENVMHLRADGIIISTPTGSTAYSLAAGGSIVVPEVDVMLMTPICPHALTARPMVLSGNSVISIDLPRCESSMTVTVDGQVWFQLASGDTVRISKSAAKVRVAKSSKRTHFEILKTKLNLGLANSGG